MLPEATPFLGLKPREEYVSRLEELYLVQRGTSKGNRRGAEAVASQSPTVCKQAKSAICRRRLRGTIMRFLVTFSV